MRIEKAGDIAVRAEAIFADIRPGEPGCAAGLMRGGRTIWTGCRGTADLAQRTAITSRTVFNVASVSKQFTALAILQLEAMGMLALDQPMATILPEIGEHARQVTIRHLLHHTSGLPDYISLAEASGVAVCDRLTKEAGLALLVAHPEPEFPAGTRHSYSNTGYFLLSLALERASGRSLREWGAERIFEPLGLADTCFVDRYPAPMPTLAHGYRRDEASGAYMLDESGWEMTGDGQVHTTVPDMLTWLGWLRTASLGGEPLLRRMGNAGVLDDGTPFAYGMGLGLGRHRGYRWVEHSGGWAGYAAFAALLPESDIAVAVFANADFLDPRGRAEKLLDLCLDADGAAP